MKFHQTQSTSYAKIRETKKKLLSQHRNVRNSPKISEEISQGQGDPPTTVDSLHTTTETLLINNRIVMHHFVLNSNISRTQEIPISNNATTILEISNTTQEGTIIILKALVIRQLHLLLVELILRH
jgi:hypothetical protein